METMDITNGKKIGKWDETKKMSEKFRQYCLTIKI